MIWRSLLIIGSLSCSNTAIADIADFDLSAFSFDITEIDRTDGSTCSGFSCTYTAIVSGLSNGIGWSISDTGYWDNRTITNDTFNFSALPGATDNLHPSADYTITFDTRIDKLLVALSNDNLTDSINFGLVPSEAIGVRFIGTQAVLNNVSGGLVLFENIDSLTITNLNDNGIVDGYDLAFHAIPVIPVPAAVWLFSGGLLALIGTARRR